MKNILFIVGSERKESFNMQIAKLVQNYIEENKLGTVRYLDYSKVPFINQDYEFPTLDIIKEIRAEVERADGLWFFTPEYNMSYPGILKNLIDWLSRSREKNNYASGTSIAGKKCAISGIGGKNKTEGARGKLQDLLTFIKAEVIVPSEGFAVNPTAFSSNIVELSEDDRNRLFLQADIFIEKL